MIDGQGHDSKAVISRPTARHGLLAVVTERVGGGLVTGADPPFSAGEKMSKPATKMEWRWSGSVG